MKKRLCGLTALLLCAVLVCSPVMAMAATYVVDDERHLEWVYSGNLIYADDDLKVESYWDSGFYTKKIIYNDNGKVEEFTFDEEERDSYPNDVWVHNLRTLPENEAWLVTDLDNAEDSTHSLTLTRVKRVFHQPITIGDYAFVVQGFDQLDPFFNDFFSQYDDVTDEDVYGQGLSEVKTELKKAIMNYLPDCSSIAYYDYALYKQGDNLSQVYSRIPSYWMPKQEMTITLPYPDGYSMANAKPEDFCIAHLYGEETYDYDAGKSIFETTMETFTGDGLNLTPDGIRITVTSLSPFALGCKAPVPVSESSSIPQTGDSFPLACVLGALLLSGAGLMAVRRRKAA